MKRQNLPIIIGGFYRSGTSLVRRLLDSHPNISCGPEVKFFRDLYGDFVKDELAHARFFRTVRSLGLSDWECLHILGSAFISCHALAAKKLNKRRWGDKNPENVLYLDQWRQLLPDGFVFLHVVRNPHDALASLKDVGFPKAVPATFDEKVALYARYASAGVTFCRTYPDQSITLSYEELVRHPKQTLTTLLERLEERFEPKMLEVFHLPERRLGLEDPKVVARADIHVESIGRWRGILTSAEQALIRSELTWLPLDDAGDWIVTLAAPGQSHLAAAGEKGL
jgi:sulfotransferase family protein